MARWTVVLGLLLLLAVALSGTAAAAPYTGCLPFPLPTTPQPPVFVLPLHFFTEHGSAQLWRQACEDGSGNMALLMRVAPTTPTLFVCSVSFDITQGGVAIDGLVTATPGGNSQCADITTTTTFLLLDRDEPKRFRERAPFSLSHDGSPPTFVQVPAPTITLINQGCTVCSPGQVVSVTAHVTNAGPALPSEIKAAVRFPDGSLVGLFDVDRPLGAGETFDLVMIPGFVMPPGITPGIYVVEAAILEPEAGLLWSRASTRLVVP